MAAVRRSNRHDMGVGRRLAMVRAAWRMQQKDFASKLGTGERAYRNYELGRRSFPAVLLPVLSAEYLVDVMWVLTGNDANPDLIGRDFEKPDEAAEAILVRRPK